MSRRIQVQFSVRGLLLLIAAAAAAALVIRLLLRWPGAGLIAMAIAAAVGACVGTAVCLVVKLTSGGKPSVYVLLIATIAVVGCWFAGHFISYFVGLLAGACLVQFGGLLLNELLRMSGLTFRTRQVGKDDSAE